mmetsp:Transcript_5477/g.13729  ORF Transcript_5477/g.13729 Transcript_5477/m.13729 type:complete len:478 (+) Transcript_5477:134-1567(+)|eukprot:CAMPEP_0181081634 /NCGR_PEP_ID=MMETSP1071-20121207/3201_1 /TAXON_ID=35127 /ORGANISM="Thalassiosira sp., Strain NH16" /LENGTH=477 /DNA_ID=CAMNT_0023163183 /DNA_START=89 /DNA_END=1522 /DNA_ORIENTATION=-
MTGMKFSFYESAPAGDVDVDESVEVNESNEVDDMKKMSTAYSEEEGTLEKMNEIEELEFVDAKEEEGCVFYVEEGTVGKLDTGPNVDKVVTKHTRTKSEDTIATATLSIDPTISFASTINTSDEYVPAVPVPASHSQVLSPIPDTPSTASGTQTGSLTARMLERVQGIDKIRGLLESEKEHESQVVSKFAAKIAMLERAIGSKDKQIGSLTKNVENLTTKNDENGLQLSNLSTIINELVVTNGENLQRITELEKDVTAKDSTIKEIGEEIQDKQLKIGSLTKSVQNLETKSANDALQLIDLSATINELAENNNESQQRITGLENDVTAKDSIIKQMDEDIQDKQLTLNKNAKDNAALVDLVETLEEETKDIKTKNDDYAVQLSNLFATISELVECNDEHVQKISLLEEDISSKDSKMKEMDDEIKSKQQMVDKNAKENAALAEQLKDFEAENKALDAMAQQLESTILAKRRSRLSGC